MKTKNRIPDFQKKVLSFYALNKREFVWRYSDNPYYVLVSEFMLQQTQTVRVKEKFPLFIEKFPTIFDLAHATFADILSAWQGLGYNRRAKYIYQAAQTVVQKYNGIIPKDINELLSIDGIGSYTAAAISTFAYNKAEVFIETNIRTVFLYEFFYGASNIHDKQIRPLVAKTLDHINPRSWYYALMDYGVFLKKEMKNNVATQSVHYAKQSSFIGSRRQIRGMVIKLLTHHQRIKHDDLYDKIKEEAKNNHHNVQDVVHELEKEGLIECTNDFISIKNYKNVQDKRKKNHQVP
jgi:A/G-specific adenine glycosylase